MKIGIILFIFGLILVAILIKARFDKDIVKNIGIFIGVVLALYGIVLMVQPSEDKYFDYTKSTISKQDLKIK